MNYIITQELAQRILNYLAGRIYSEVFELIDALKVIKPELKEEKTKEEKEV